MRWSPTEALLALGTTLRLTRLVVTDDLGAWWVRDPALAWAKEVDPDGTGWPTKAVDGLDCPFCVGFWIGAGVLASRALARTTRPTSALWTFAASTLTLNEVAAHISARLDT